MVGETGWEVSVPTWGEFRKPVDNQSTCGLGAPGDTSSDTFPDHSLHWVSSSQTQEWGPQNLHIFSLTYSMATQPGVKMEKLLGG